MRSDDWQRVSVSQLHRVEHGATVMVLGRLERHARGVILTSRDHHVDLIGEPFDWKPEHGTRLEVWGQILHSIRTQLVVHNARRLGDTAKQPRRTPLLIPGAQITLDLRVIALGDHLAGITEDQQTLLIDWPAGSPGLWSVKGHLSMPGNGLAFHVEHATPLSGAFAVRQEDA